MATPHRDPQRAHMDRPSTAPPAPSSARIRFFNNGRELLAEPDGRVFDKYDQRGRRGRDSWGRRGPAFVPRFEQPAWCLPSPRSSSGTMAQHASGPAARAPIAPMPTEDPQWRDKWRPLFKEALAEPIDDPQFLQRFKLVMTEFRAERRRRQAKAAEAEAQAETR